MRGIALLQLLIALAVAALLLGLGAASWQPLVAQFRLRVAVTAVGRTLAQARLAALASGRTVRVCPSADRRRCVTAAAAALLVVDERGLPLPGAAADPLPVGVRVSANRPAVTWYPWPRAASTVTLELCAVPGGRESQRVIVSQAGRVRSERGPPC